MNEFEIQEETALLIESIMHPDEDLYADLVRERVNGGSDRGP